jgi:hypothetical protein
LDATMCVAKSRSTSRIPSEMDVLPVSICVRT